MSDNKVHSVLAPPDPSKVSLGVRTLCIALLLTAAPSAIAKADCGASPGNPNDLLISFLAANNTQVAPALLHASTVKEGMFVYDDTANALKYCNGTAWETLLTNSAGASGVAGAVQFSGGSGVFSSDDANLHWDNTTKRLGIGTATPAHTLNVAGNVGIGTVASPAVLTVYGGYGATPFVIKNSNGASTSFSITNNGGLASSNVSNGRMVLYGDMDRIGFSNGMFSLPSANLFRMSSGGGGGTTFQLGSSHGSVAGNPTQSLEFVSNLGASTWSTSASINAAVRNNLDGTLKFFTAESTASTGLATNLREIARFTSSGSLGIGTATPQSMLHVAGGIQLADDAAVCPGTSDVKLGTLKYVSDVLSVCKTTGWAAIAASGAGATQWQDGTGGAIYYNGGNVGIGASIPAEKLEVTGNILLSSGADRTIGVAPRSSSKGDSLTISAANTTNPSAVAGNLILKGGGTPLTGGSGAHAGSVFLLGGASTASFADGGNIAITGGSSTGGSGQGQGGGVTISGGSGRSNSTARDGGSIRLAAGNITYGANGGGDITLTAGNNNHNTGGAGAITLTAGSTNQSAVRGGTISLQPGNGTGAGGGRGDVLLAASGGNVGIGTSSPSAKLQIAGNNQTFSIDTSTFALTKLTPSGNLDIPLTASSTVFISPTTGDALVINKPSNNLYNGLTVHRFDSDRNDRYAILVDNQAGNTLFGVTGTGNVGIGTTSPASRLQVAGGIQLSDDAATCPGASDVKLGTLRFNGGDLQLCKSGGWSAIGTGGGSSQWQDGTGGAIYYSGGNVGIGTAAPKTPLHVFTGTGAELTDGTGYALIGDQDAPNLVLDDNEIQARDNAAAAMLRLQHKGGDLSLVQGGGKVGIGTTTPTARFQVHTGGASTIGSIIRGASSQTANLTEWRNNSDAVLSSVTAAGVFTGPGSGLTNLNASNLASGTVPTARLATGTADGSTYLRGDGTWAAVSGGATPAGNDGSLQFKSGSNLAADAFNLHWDDTSDRLGIGTNTPLYPVDVRGTPGSQLHFSSDGTDAGGYLVSNDADNFYLASGMAWNGTQWIAKSTAATVIGGNDGRINFATSDGVQTPGAPVTMAFRMWIENGGNVGIGTTSPASKLQVAGGIQLADDAATCPGASDVKLGTLKYASNVLSICNAAGWIAIDTGGVGGTTPAGNDGSIQFKSGGNLAADAANLHWDDTNNRLGIGTTTPRGRLNVYGSGQTTADLDTTTGDLSNMLVLQSSNIASGDGGGIVFGTRTVGGATDGLWAAIKGTAVSGNNYSAGDLSISTRTVNTDTTLTEKIRIKANGNVGIGTTNPTYKLDVIGYLKTGGYGSVPGGVALHSAAGGSFMWVDNPTGQYTRFSSGALPGGDGDWMVVRNNGNVGIGTTGPVDKLQVGSFSMHDGGDKVLFIGQTSAQDLNASKYSAEMRFDETNGLLKFGVSNSPAGAVNGEAANGSAILNVKSGGNVGVGVAAPTARLQIATAGGGNLYVSDYGCGGGWSGIGGSATLTGCANYALITAGADTLINRPSGYAIRFREANAEQMIIAGGGNVGIGTTTPSYKLHVAGQIAGAGAYINTSDARLKTDVRDLDYSLNTVMRLRPVSFQWKTQVENWQKGRKLGFIAQEMEKVTPEVVSTANDADQTKSIAYGDLTPILVKAVQDLKAASDNLRADNDNLRADLESLRQEVRAIKSQR